MGYAIELSIADSQAGPIRRAFLEIGSIMSSIGASPHVSLAVFDDLDVESASAIVGSYSRQVAQFRLRFSSIGLFPGIENVLFLAPVVTVELLRLHEALHLLLDANGIHGDPKYHPGSWVPHCTIDLDRPLQETLESMKHIHGQGLFGEYLVDRIHVIQFRPVISLAEFALAE